ncbi:MAG: argininosuccinate lyase [Candidatus Anstonellales archaeon]
MKNTKNMLWGGRFSQTPKANLLSYNSKENIVNDYRLIPYDIIGSIAHVKMLRHQNILTKKEAASIIKALEKLLKKYKKGQFSLNPSLEDVHMNIEVEVSKMTPHGKKMHTARSRNDQVILDMRLYMRDELISIALMILNLCTSLDLLKKINLPFISYTHTRVAQPITLAFWADSYKRAILRDLERIFNLHSRINQNPLGACAVAGTTWNINREYTAKLLGFQGVQDNAHDVSTNRGELESEFVYILSSIMIKLSRISEEFLFLSEKGIIEIPDAYCTGSSIMPQKKNADFLEIMRARASRTIGNLLSILTILKGLPSGFNSDTQEIKPLLFSSIDMTKESISLMSEVLPQIKINKEEVIYELEKGYACSTELADLLCKKGIPFREAHELTGKIVKECIQKEIYLSSLTSKELELKSGIKISDEELKIATNPDKSADARFDMAHIDLSAYKRAVFRLRKKSQLRI